MLSFLKKRENGRKQYFFLNHLVKTHYNLIVHFHAQAVKEKIYFKKVKKLFSVMFTLLNDLFLSFRAFMYWVVRKITTRRITIGQ